MELPPEVVLKEHHAGLDRELFVLVCKLTVHLSRPLLNPSVDQTDLFLRETKLFKISHRNQSIHSSFLYQNINVSKMF